MKRFLVLGMVFLVGFLFLGINGYAEEGKKEIKHQLYFILGWTPNFTKAHYMSSTGSSYLNADIPFGIGALCISRNGKFFSEANVAFYNPVEFSFSCSWMVVGWNLFGEKKFLEKEMFGILGGVGVYDGRMEKRENKNKYFITAHYGVKAAIYPLYVDLKYNYTLFRFKSYLSFTVGLIF